ncbi:hypothetical protein IT411_02045 [Candidatus Peregrinibacteria bacterium]|nr:hypothetical protein [Candidatus Peregrinibacteria bacterium]
MINKIKNWLKEKSKAETILEVIIALVVITIGSATATSLILSAIKANIFNKDLLTALNMAQEGIEFMRNTRDTNWIKFSSDTQGCWHMRPEAVACSTGNVISTNDGGTGSGYALGGTLSNKVTSVLELNDGIGGTESSYRLSYWDADPTADSDDDGTNNNDLDLVGSNAPSGSAIIVKDTHYYRAIYVDYKKIANTSPWALSDPAAPEESNGDLMQVTSVVQWMDGPTRHQVSLSSSLTRYK